MSSKTLTALKSSYFLYGYFIVYSIKVKEIVIGY